MIGPYSISVTWLPPIGLAKNLDHIIYYKIRYQNTSYADSNPIILEKIFEINDTNRDNLPYETVLDDLRGFTEYRLQILAGTKVGDGPTSIPITIKTDEDGKIMIGSRAVPDSLID